MRRSRLAVLLLVVTLVTTGLPAIPLGGDSPASAQPSGGPVALLGIDAEDGGPGGHGPIANYIQLTNDVLSKVNNDNTGGILVIGGGKNASDNVTTFWNQIGSGTGETITYVNGVSNIASRSFSGFEVVAVISSSNETASGGLTVAENDALTERATDVASFVNAGGGLIGFEQSQASSPFAYVGGLGDFTVSTTSYSNIDPTAAGTAVGITDALDVCCWHQVFDTYPEFLTVLATTPIGGNNRVAALGGQVTTLTGDQPPTPDGQTIGSCRHGSIAYEEHASAWVQCMADPVNTATGAFEEAVLDATLPGIGIPFEFRRSYSSADAFDGPLGVGWTHNYDVALMAPTAVSAGDDFSLALRGDGTVWAWGWNQWGQVGDGTTGTIRNVPVQVTGLTDVSAIAAGSNHSVAVRSDGTVWAWGLNQRGQLGDGTTTSRTVPVQVIGLNNVTAIAAGFSHTLALRSDGTLWSWGDNTYGQLGDNTFTARTTPVQVSNLINATAVATGNYHSTALRADGTVWSWGLNDHGQLGIGNTADKKRPFQVTNLANVTAVSNGGYHSLGLRSDGTVWSWGRNTWGQLGDGAQVDRTAPVQVVGMTDVTEIAGGDRHSLALRAGGTAWAWGWGNNGELGDGAGVSRTTPVQVVGLTSVSDIDGGVRHSVALERDGSVRTWGLNNGGALGDGTTQLRSLTPVHVVNLNLGENAGSSGRTFRAESGQRIVYERQPDGSFTAGPGVRSTLAAVSGGYELTRTDQVVYRFDSIGRLTSKVDRNGQGLSFGYNASQQLATITDEAGRVVSLGYDTAGHLATVTLPDLRQVVYGYTGNLLTSVTDLAGKVWTYGYDSAGRLDEIIDPNGNFVIRNTYDPATGRVIEQRDPLGNLSTFSWDPDTETATMTDAAGKTWTARYFSNVLLRVTDPLGHSTGYDYDENLTLDAVTDANGNSTQLQFDAAGNLLSRTAPAPFNYTESWIYNVDNDVTSYTDGRNRTTSYTYDAVGRLASETRPDDNVPTGAVTSFTYDPVTGKVAAITDPRDNTTTYTYDQFGNRTAIITATGAKTTFTYDPGGRVTSIVEPRGNEPGANPDDYRTTYTYDNLGRPLTERDPLGREIAFGYDNAGNRITVTDPNLNVTGYRYNAANELVAETDPLQHTRRFDYDARGLLARTTAPTGSVTTYEYDDAARQIAMVEPRGNVTSLSLPGTTGSNASTPDAPPLDITGDIDIRVSVSLTDWSPSSVQMLAAKQPAGGSTGYSLRVTTAGGLRLDWGNGTSTLNATSTAATAFADGSSHWVRATLDVSDGAGNRVANFYTSEDGATWNQLGATVTTAGATVIAANTDNLYAGSTSIGDNAVTGAMSALEIRSGIDGTIVANPTFSAQPAGATSFSDDRPNTWSINSAASIVASANPNDFRWTYGYDDVGNPTTITDPLGHATTRTYDALNRLATVTDPRGVGHTTVYGYDANSNRISETNPLSQATTYGYDAVNRLITQTNARNKTTTYGHDVAGNRVSMTTPLGNRTTWEYDDDNRMTAMVEPRGNVAGANPADFRWTYGYDAAGNRTSEASPLGHTTTMVFDRVGNLTAETDARQKTTDYAYDELGRLEAVTAPDAAETAYVYDVAGRLLTRTDANDHTTTYSYDAADRLVQTLSPLGQRWNYRYDAASNRTTVIDAVANAAGNPALGTTTYSYDRAGRLVGLDYSDTTPDVSFGYDQANNRTSMIDGSGTVSYVYDAAGRLTSYTRGPDTIGYTYSPTGRVESRTYPGQPTTSYTYDDDDRLATATTGGETISYGYNPAGQLTSTLLPNGYNETRTHDRDGRLANLTHTNGTTTLAAFTYTRDPVGNATVVDATTGIQTYTYDDQARLTSVCHAASCAPSSPDLATFGYDPVGNRTSETTGTTTKTYTYNAADQLTQITGGQQTTLAYDENGNLTADGTRTYTYDLGRRTNTITAGSVTTTYSYDGDGNRLQASTGGGPSDITKYLWDTNQAVPQVALERDGAGALSRGYRYGIDRTTMVTGGANYYFHHDGLGSVTNITDTAGATRWTYSYEPFGAERSAQSGGSTVPNTMRFAGEQLDSTGLYHLRARQYDPGTGRLTTTDPLEPGMDDPYVSAYVYASNSPVNRVDPLGLRASDLIGASPRQRTFAVPRIPGGGRVRIGQFIQEAVVSQFGVEIGTGDDRAFNPDMIDRDNRVYLEVDFESGQGRLFYNYSCEANGVTCYDALSPEKTSSITQRANGVSVSYTIGNSVAQADLDRCNRNGLNCTFYEFAALFKISASFDITSNGWGVCVSGRHSRFPSTEIYFDDDTGTHTIRQYDQIPGAVLALGVPDSEFGCEIADLPNPMLPGPIAGPDI